MGVSSDYALVIPTAGHPVKLMIAGWGGGGRGSKCAVVEMQLHSGSFSSSLVVRLIDIRYYIQVLNCTTEQSKAL